MFQTLHEISKNLIFVFVWKYVWKYVNINVSDIKKKKKIQINQSRNPLIFVFSKLMLHENWLNLAFQIIMGKIHYLFDPYLKL